MISRFGILGGGTFGRALATAVARHGHEVILTSRRPDPEPLKGVTIVPNAAPLCETELIFVCVPSRVIESAADELAEVLDGRHRLVHVSRGLAGDELRPLSSVLRDRTPCRRIGVLAGPLVENALESGRPGGAVVGTRFPEVASAVRVAIAGESLRVYDTDDVVGVEVASAFVGVLALALGCGDALGLGPAALATLATRGVSEASRFAASFGANPATFFGLAGMGDLIAVVAGDQRPEFLLGQHLARGVPLEEARALVSSNIESVALVSRLVAHAERTSAATPILGAIANVLDGKHDPRQALARLMRQRVGREGS